MKYLVNGVEAGLTESDDVQIRVLTDRLSVTSGGSTSTALSVRVGNATLVSYRGRTYRVERARRASAEGAANGELRSPMPGQIVEVACAEGDEVEDGQRLLVLEAMKMQQPVVAPFAGSIQSVRVGQGDQVGEGQVLVVVLQQA